jgi:hypothetical protein
MAQEAQKIALEKVSHLLDDSKQVADRVMEKSKDLYGKFEDRVPENARKALLLGASGLLVGFVGYRLGKSHGRGKALASRSAEKLAERSSELASEIPKKAFNIDYSPVYKLVKLWMLYRIAL